MNDAEYFKTFAESIFKPTRIPMRLDATSDIAGMMVDVRLSPKYRRVELPQLATYPAEALASFITPRHLYVECKTIGFKISGLIISHPHTLLEIVQRDRAGLFILAVTEYQRHDPNLTESEVAALIASDRQKLEQQQGVEGYSKVATPIVRQLEDAWRAVEDEAISIAQSKYDA